MTVLSPKAEWDIIESVAYYAKIDKELAIKFKNELQERINNISLKPSIYPVVYRTYRRALTRNFSFAIYFTIEENNDVIIDAIFSQKISNKVIKQRLG